VDGIDFPTEGVHACATSGKHRGQEPLKYGVVGGIGEDWLTGIATLYDVVNATRYMKSGST
jgi:hypothetical protein